MDNSIGSSHSLPQLISPNSLRFRNHHRHSFHPDHPDDLRAEVSPKAPEEPFAEPLTDAGEACTDSDKGEEDDGEGEKAQLPGLP